MGRAQGSIASVPEVTFDVHGKPETVTVTFRFSGERARDAAIREAAKLGLPQKAIASSFGIGQPQVSKILRKHTKGISRKLRRRR